MTEIQSVAILVYLKQGLLQHIEQVEGVKLLELDWNLHVVTDRSNAMLNLLYNSISSFLLICFLQLREHW